MTKQDSNQHHLAVGREQRSGRADVARDARRHAFDNSRRDLDERLDRALEDTFPASDPVAVLIASSPERVIAPAKMDSVQSELTKKLPQKRPATDRQRRSRAKPPSEWRPERPGLDRAELRRIVIEMIG